MDKLEYIEKIIKMKKAGYYFILNTKNKIVDCVEIRFNKAGNVEVQYVGIKGVYPIKTLVHIIEDNWLLIHISGIHSHVKFDKP